MRQATSIILAVTVIALTSVAGADVIREASAVIRNDPGNGIGSIAGYIDQSGLQTNYVSGTTDFDTYDPTSVANTGFGSAHWFGTQFQSGITDFDLGVSDVVTRVATWTFPQPTDNQTGVFEVYVSDDPTFSTAGALGTYTILDNGSGSQAFGQVFDIPDTQGRYVRIDHILPIGSGTFVGGGEIAFATTSAVPEPATSSVAWLALSGMVWMLRRKRRTS